MNQYTCKRCQLPTEREDQHDVFLCVTALKTDNNRLRAELAKRPRYPLSDSPNDGEYKTGLGYANIYTEEERDA